MHILDKVDIINANDESVTLSSKFVSTKQMELNYICYFKNKSLVIFCIYFPNNSFISLIDFFNFSLLVNQESKNIHLYLKSSRTMYFHKN